MSIEKRFSQLNLDIKTQRRLLELRRELWLPSKAAVVRYLLAEHTKKTGARPAIYSEVFADTRPIIIAGPSGSGKTTTVKSLISRFEGAVLVLDPSNEYGDFEGLSYANVSSIRWDKPVRVTKKVRYKVLFSADVGVSQVEASLVFRQLALAMSQGSLKEWTVVVEEAHRFSNDPELKALVLEARKGTRKLLILTAQPGPFAELAPTFGPSARQGRSPSPPPSISSASPSE